MLGFFNSDGRTTLRDLKSGNRVPAVRNTWYDLRLVEADLSEGDPANTAILNESPRAFLRGIKQTGYGHLLKDSKGAFHDGTAMDEWFEGKAQSLFSAAAARLPT